MSLEKQSEALLEAVTKLILTATDIISSKKAAPAATAGEPTTGKVNINTKVTKKDLADLKKSAKGRAGEVLKKLGKEKLEELLSRFGADKFSAILNEADVFSDLIAMAEKMLNEKPVIEDDDDLLGDSDPEPTKAATLEDVKALLLKVNNTDGLGRDVTRQILAELGATKLGDLKKDKFNEAVALAEKAVSTNV